MDSKLQDAVEREDWYSAHQIFLALAQKHQRGKRQSELVDVLIEGTITLAKAKQVNSTEQLADKLVASLNEVNDRLVAVFQALWEMQPSSAVSFGNALVDKIPSSAGFMCRAASTVGCEEAGRYALLAKDLDLIKKLGEGWSEDAWCRLVARCLISKNFQAASILISSKLSHLAGRKTIDDPSGTLPSFTAITEVPVVNFCQILFMICQRRCEKSMLHDLLKEHNNNVMLPEDWIKALERTYWPPVVNAPPVNPLAQMMQNLMRPNPSSSSSPSSQQNNSSSSRRIDDLD